MSKRPCPYQKQDGGDVEVHQAPLQIDENTVAEMGHQMAMQVTPQFIKALRPPTQDEASAVVETETERGATGQEVSVPSARVMSNSMAKCYQPECNDNTIESYTSLRSKQIISSPQLEAQLKSPQRENQYSQPQEQSKQLSLPVNDLKQYKNSKPFRPNVTKNYRRVLFLDHQNMTSFIDKAGFMENVLNHDEDYLLIVLYGPDDSKKLRKYFDTGKNVIFVLVENVLDKNAVDRLMIWWMCLFHLQYPIYITFIVISGDNSFLILQRRFACYDRQLIVVSPHRRKGYTDKNIMDSIFKQDTSNGPSLIQPSQLDIDIKRVIQSAERCKRVTFNYKNETVENSFEDEIPFGNTEKIDDCRDNYLTRLTKKGDVDEFNFYFDVWLLHIILPSSVQFVINTSEGGLIERFRSGFRTSSIINEIGVPYINVYDKKRSWQQIKSSTGSAKYELLIESETPTKRERDAGDIEGERKAGDQRHHLLDQESLQLKKSNPFGYAELNARADKKEGSKFHRERDAYQNNKVNPQKRIEKKDEWSNKHRFQIPPKQQQDANSADWKKIGNFDNRVTLRTGKIQPSRNENEEVRSKEKGEYKRYDRRHEGQGADSDDWRKKEYVEVTLRTGKIQPSRNENEEV